MPTDIRQTGYPSIDKPWRKYYDGFIEDLEIPSCTVFEYLQERCKDYIDDVALSYFGQEISYKDLMKKIDKVARALLVAGIENDEIVSVCLPNTPEAVYLIYAINKIGAVANMLDVRSGEGALETALIDSESRILFCLDSVTNKFVNVLPNTKVEIAVAVSPVESMPAVARVIAKKSNKELNQKIREPFINWKSFVRNGNGYSGRLDKSVWYADKAAYIDYTGGTTGIPKGVIATNENIIAQSKMQSLFGHNGGRGNSCLDIAPPWTYYGLCNSLNNCLCEGMRVILIPKFENEEFGSMFVNLKPNYIIAVPAALYSIIESSDLKDADLSFIKCFILGADKLDENLEIKMNEFLENHNCNVVIQKGYGMTEVMAAATCTKKGADSIGSVGIPCPGVTVSSFNEIDEKYLECKVGEKGEVCIQSPTIMKGYFGPAEKETSSVVKIHDDGKLWAHTGDIGYVGEDGRVYIEGRIKRMFTRNGFKVFPATIENCLMQHDNVLQAAVVSVQDDLYGNVTKAFVVMKNDDIKKDSIIQDLSELTAKNLYDYEIPDIYEFINEIPLTDMGKVDYRKLEAF